MVDDAFTGIEGELGITAACRLTGRSRATHYRRLRPAPPRGPRKRQVQPSALTPEERAAVLELMNSGEHAELPPAQIWARELDAGRYHCSVSTMYRILRKKRRNGERRRQATRPAKTVSLFHHRSELARCRARTAWTSAVMRVVEHRIL
ncbi:helix-turn-helix domain-containing protein, partial [Streptomyces sp. NPDC059176]|uniref:helix-turn-helix domain-containing protein n=1 Tax=Streptomyces sp. NPDC059176 TaxID=3346758 RepID=UPI0036C10C2B